MSRIIACIILYVRYSSSMQREESCEDQERDIRKHLDSLGINHGSAVVLSDKATSGTKKSRAGYRKIEQMVKDGKAFLLVVLDLSRLSRTSGVKDLITDIRFNSGRFISVRDGIDTDRPGWELPTSFGEAKNAVMVTGLGPRVHGAQEGRILKDDASRDYYGSVGDQCFGLTSLQDDPAWVYSKNDPKPRKHVVVYEPEAKWVREVFRWFVVLCWSILQITRELNRLGVPKGHRSSKPGWHHTQVRRLLGNSKYVGTWTWGRRRNIRNSKGKVKQEQAPEEDVVTVERPGLRIVDNKTWALAQKKLAKLAKVYGKKNGQKPRGAKVHSTDPYPSGLLNRLLVCGHCGARLIYQTGGTDVYFGCPAHRKGPCPQATRAPRERTEKALLDFLAGEFRSVPGWMDKVMASLDAHLKELDVRVPQEIEGKSKARDGLNKKIANITDAIESSGSNSAHLTTRLAEHEVEIARLESEIEQAEELQNVSLELPAKTWIAEQISDLADILKGDVRRAALLLRDILGKVQVHEVIPAGKRRGFARLKFTIDAWAVASRVLEEADGFPSAALATAPGRDFKSQEIRLDVGGPSDMDTWAPRIAEMRRKGVLWREIEEITGLKMGNAYTAWKRYTDAVAVSISVAADDHEKEVAAG